MPHRVIDGQVILPRPSDGSIVVLIGAAATVWRLLDRPATHVELIGRVSSAVGLPAPNDDVSVPGPAHGVDVEREVDVALHLLRGEGLVEQ